MSMTAVYIVGVIILIVVLMGFALDIARQKDPRQRKRLVLFYNVLIVCGVVLYVVIKGAGLSEKLFAEWHEAEETRQEYNEWSAEPFKDRTFDLQELEVE